MTLLLVVVCECRLRLVANADTSTALAPGAPPTNALRLMTYFLLELSSEELNTALKAGAWKIWRIAGKSLPTTDLKGCTQRKPLSTRCARPLEHENLFKLLFA